MTTITRFAPSPSGALHLGHAFAAFEARRLADMDGGEMRLRIEDIDQGRCRHQYLDAIYDDLAFLGIAWDGAVVVQSQRMAAYRAALERLKARDLIYPCTLTRRQLAHLLSAPHEQTPPRNTDQMTAPALGEDGQQPGQQPGQQTAPQTAQHPAWRLRMDAIEPMLRGLDFTDLRHGGRCVDFAAIGDEVIARKDNATSYHLSVVVDDAASGVTLVSRGEDLLPATPLHRILQELLGLAETRWFHHPLVMDEDGRRLAKRTNALTISRLRAAGADRHSIQDLLAKSRFSS